MPAKTNTPDQESPSSAAAAPAPAPLKKEIRETVTSQSHTEGPTAEIEWLNEDTPVALLPPGWSQADLSKALPAKAPTFRAGTVALDDPASFAAYVNRHSTPATVVYAARSPQGDGGQFIAVLDDGEPREPGRRGDRAALHVAIDPRFKEWLGLLRAPVKQAPFKEFIEDHDREFVSPTGAQMRTYVNQLAVKKNIIFKNVESEGTAAADVSLVYETETKETGSIPFPTEFNIHVPFFRHGAPYSLHGRIRFRLDDSQLLFLVKLEDLYNLVDNAWAAILEELRTSLTGGVPVLNGTP